MTKAVLSCTARLSKPLRSYGIDGISINSDQSTSKKKKVKIVSLQNNTKRPSSQLKISQNIKEQKENVKYEPMIPSGKENCLF
jgi:hypothetical protein